MVREAGPNDLVEAITWIGNSPSLLQHASFLTNNILRHLGTAGIKGQPVWIGAPTIAQGRSVISLGSGCGPEQLLLDPPWIASPAFSSFEALGSLGDGLVSDELPLPHKRPIVEALAPLRHLDVRAARVDFVRDPAIQGLQALALWTMAPEQGHSKKGTLVTLERQVWFEGADRQRERLVVWRSGTKPTRAKVLAEVTGVLARNRPRLH